MQILVSGRHVPVDDALKQYATGKLEKLVKYYDRIQSIEVVYDEEAGQPSVEVLVNIEPKNTVVGRDSGADAYAATDTVFDKLERQLTRHKDKYKDHKHPH